MKSVSRFFLLVALVLALGISTIQAQTSMTWDQIEVDREVLAALRAGAGTPPSLASLEAAYIRALSDNPQDAIKISVAALNLLHSIIGTNVPFTDPAFIDPAIRLLESGVRTLSAVPNPPFQSVATLISFATQIAGPISSSAVAIRLFNASVDSLPAGPGRQGLISSLSYAVASTIGIGMPVSTTMQTLMLLNRILANRAVDEGLSLMPISIPGTGGIGGNSPFGTTRAFSMDSPPPIISLPQGPLPSPSPAPTPAPSPGPYGS